MNRPFRFGDRVRLLRLPEWVDVLPEESRAVFRYCVGKEFPVSGVDARGMVVLDVSGEVDESFGGTGNELHVEAAYLEAASGALDAPVDGGGLPGAVRQWRRQGRIVEVEGRRIFVVEDGDRAAQAVFILHGFPCSSFDWRAVVPRLAERARVVTFDFLGFGLSDKPDESYSLLRQADLAAAVAAAVGLESCTLVAHDMGDTVAAELLARSHDGELDLEIERVVLTNGSIFVDMAQLTSAQQILLSMPDAALPEPFPLEAFRPAVRSLYADEHRPAEEEIEALIALLRHGGGDRMLPRLIRYIEERRLHQKRWSAALVAYDRPLTALWGEQDPVAVVAMAHRLADLRPATEVVVWDDVGHWPSVEVPERLAKAILDRLAW